MNKKINYIKIVDKKYKYRLIEDYVISLSFRTNNSMVSDYYSLDINGNLLIFKGYKWDGASGPTIDTQNTIRASLVHDVLYQMIRECKLDIAYKRQCDNELYLIMKEDWEPKTIFGKLWNSIRASYFYQAVNWFGSSSCIPNCKG